MPVTKKVNKIKDSDDVYRLMLKELKKELKSDECASKLQAIKLAMDFCKLFGLNDMPTEKDVSKFVESLPFKRIG